MLSKNQRKANRLLNKLEIHIDDIHANQMYGNLEQIKISELEIIIIKTKILELIE